MYESVRKNAIAQMAGTVDINRWVCSYTGPIGRTSGNIMVLRGIEGAVILIHAPIGCGYFNKLVPRMHKPYDRLHCSDMGEEDIIFGCSSKLADTIEKIIQEEAPSLIAVIPGSCSEMISSDIFEAVDRFQNDSRCAVIGIQPKCFSHRDRRTGCTNGQRTARCPTEEGLPPEGCGSNEAVCTIVERLMEKQPREEDLVNAWVIPANNVGIGFCDSGDMLQAFAQTLAKVGLHLNPLTTVDAVRKASAAAYNLAGVCRWSNMMHHRFGTGCYEINGDSEFVQEMCTIQGARKVFLMIADPFGKREEMARVLDEEYSHFQERHERIKKAYRKYRYALYSWNWNVTGTLKALKEDFGIVPEYFIYHINEEWLLEHGYGQELDEQRRSFREAIAGACYEGVTIPAQDLDQIHTCLTQADILINGEALMRYYPTDSALNQVKKIRNPVTYRPLSLSGRIEQMEANLFHLENAHCSHNGLLQKISQYREAHPEQSRAAELSQTWWRRQWIGDE